MEALVWSIQRVMAMEVYRTRQQFRKMTKPRWKYSTEPWVLGQKPPTGLSAAQHRAMGCRRVGEPTLFRKFRVAPRAKYVPLGQLISCGTSQKPPCFPFIFSLFGWEGGGGAALCSVGSHPAPRSSSSLCSCARASHISCFRLTYY
jgi:hypothetical protein